MSCASPDPAQWSDDRVNELWAESARFASLSRTAASVLASLCLLSLVGVHIVGWLEPSPVLYWCELPLGVLLAMLVFLAGYGFAEVGWFKHADAREQTLRRIQAQVSAETAAAEDKISLDKEFWYHLFSGRN